MIDVQNSEFDISVFECEDITEIEDNVEVESNDTVDDSEAHPEYYPTHYEYKINYQSILESSFEDCFDIDLLSMSLTSLKNTGTQNTSNETLVCSELIKNVKLSLANNIENESYKLRLKLLLPMSNNCGT